MVTNKGIEAPAKAFNARPSRQLSKYFEKIKTAVPVKRRPGCQHKHDSIEQKPAQKGLSFAISNNVHNPKTIIGSFGRVPLISITAKSVDNSGTRKASAAARRL